MNITSAKYENNSEGKSVCVNIVVGNVTMSVPLDPANTDYAEILRQVAAGTLTIEEAD